MSHSGGGGMSHARHRSTRFHSGPGTTKAHVQVMAETNRRTAEAARRRQALRAELYDTVAEAFAAEKKRQR